MQKVMIIKDDATLATLNEELAQEEFAISKIAANQNGSWLVVLDDEEYETLEDFLDYEDEDEEEEDQAAEMNQ